MAYQIQTAAYEGPLDLLLQLISKAKIDIKDIFVSEITEQYLEIVSDMERMDMESVSEFLSLAATLLYIKSRSLLPKQVQEPDVEEEKQRLIQNLYEYRRIKEAANSMALLETGALENFYKLPDEYMFSENEVVLEGLSVQDLFSGLLDLLKEKSSVPVTAEPTTFTRKKVASVVERANAIRRRLRGKRSILFTELFSDSTQKDDIIASFLALLELISSGEVYAVQDRSFGNIVIGLAENREKGDIESHES